MYVTSRVLSGWYLYLLPTDTWLVRTDSKVHNFKYIAFTLSVRLTSSRQPAICKLFNSLFIRTFARYSNKKLRMQHQRATNTKLM